MGSAVKDVHHGYRETVGAYAAEKSVKRHLQSGGCSLGCCDGNCQDGIGAKVGLSGCAVCLEHCSVHCIGVCCVQAQDCVPDHCVDVLHSLQDSFTAIASFVTVS